MCIEIDRLHFDYLCDILLLVFALLDTHYYGQGKDDKSYEPACVDAEHDSVNTLLFLLDNLLG